MPNTLMLHDIKKIILQKQTRWVTEGNSFDGEPRDAYMEGHLLLDTGDYSKSMEINTFAPAGIIIEDADQYEIDYTTDNHGIKTMFINRIKPELKDGQKFKGEKTNA
jgi:hypothetical protein|tara:strand:+ start:891 stop:1211 length:321 start_codon:yes stop_codon:yes gene_type:complete